MYILRNLYESLSNRCSCIIRGSLAGEVGNLIEFVAMPPRDNTLKVKGIDNHHNRRLYSLCQRAMQTEKGLRQRYTNMVRRNCGLNLNSPLFYGLIWQAKTSTLCMHALCEFYTSSARICHLGLFFPIRSLISPTSVL